VPAQHSTGDQVTALAEELTRHRWTEISADLGEGSVEAREVSLQLAQHVWCDLLIGLVRVLEEARQALATVPDTAKELVKQAILKSSKQKLRNRITRRVVDAVVDRVWPAFLAVATGHLPVVGILSSAELLRDLRILAVFICPAPEEHLEVRHHAMQPLGDDALHILTDETRARLAAIFTDWQTTTADQPLP
jgi:hypothetical protein